VEIGSKATHSFKARETSVTSVELLVGVQTSKISRRSVLMMVGAPLGKREPGFVAENILRSDVSSC
jgi:hypothetical protein